MTETDDNRFDDPDDIAQRVIETSLDNPDLGAKRLVPLLRLEGIDMPESSVYKIMKQNGLDTEKKRLARPEQRSRAAAPVSSEAETGATKLSFTGAGQTFPAKEQPMTEPPAVQRIAYSDSACTGKRMVQERKRQTGRRRSPRKTSKFITLVNAALILLAVFVGYHDAVSFLDARRAPEPVELNSVPVEIAVKTAKAQPAPLLTDYRAVWERNLFNVSSEASRPQKAKTQIVQVAVADRSIGLTLLGTVAADTEDNRFAVIKTKKRQDIFHEGSMAGGFLVRKILRNKVIIASSDGERLLALESGSAGNETVTQQPTAIALSSPEGAEPASRNPAGGRFRSVELPFGELIAGLEDVDQLIQEVGTRSYSRFGKHSGFRIWSVPDDNILDRIGLRSRDAILAINGIPIKDESEARAFFEKLAEGEKTFIKYHRRARTRTIELNPI